VRFSFIGLFSCHILKNSFLDLSRGSKAAKEEDSSNYERAQKAILNAVTSVEGKVQKVVEAEVNSLFHDLGHPEKVEVATKAKKVVETAASKVKKQVDEHAEKDVYPYEPKEVHNPYEWPHKKEGQEGESRILHAIEAAEKAVLHAVEEEVDTLFHELKHREDKVTAEKAKKVVKKGIKKSVKEVDQKHEHRRGWLSGDSSALIEDYMEHDLE